ncbi:MAG: hypothetical protein JWM34_3513 [Ilumatobacteraceae bacterium]|nr:hypothetical protein [Ilumatobacteraceae bacterium]
MLLAMNRRTSILIALGLLAAAAPLGASSVAHATTGGQQVDIGVSLAPPDAIDTSGDYATDTFSDPWDFSNVEDVVTVPQVGAFNADSVDISNGLLSAATRDGAQIRLLMNWSQPTQDVHLPVLPWGRDGWAHPINADKYTQADFSIRADQTMNMAIRWWNAAGQVGAIPFTLKASSDLQTLHFDLTDRANYPFAGSDAVWGGTVVRFELFRAPVGGNPAINLQLDWFRLHTAASSRTPNTRLPVPQTLSPNFESGNDYATVENGNPWDYTSMDDVPYSNQVANLSINGDGDLVGTTVGNDAFIGLPLVAPLNTDRYHHFTADVCYSGPFSLEDTAGGGMNGRVIWMPHGTGTWVETQDFIVFPGCHTIDLDLDTTPASAVNDENTTLVTGWRGVRIDQLRFDLDEDRGHRDFTVKNIRLTDDTAFSTTYPITFDDAYATPRTTADLYVTTAKGDYSGTQIASNLAVGAGTNTYTWNGNDLGGTPLPNGTYWVYTVMKNAAGVGVGYSNGPLRIEKTVSTAPSYYVPLTPARLLDTRNGIGGNIWPIDTDSFTELPVTGVGGVPLAGVTAVVMNITATNATGDGYITAWPSGEPRPLVSNINFVPGQTVPNLVTVKVGANGRVNLYNSAGHTDLIADVAGYYTTIPPAAGGKFTAVTPARLLDTRSGVGAPAASLGQDQQLNLGVTGVGGVPTTGVTAVALNVTVDQPTGTGYLTVWPTGEARPTASTHNFVPGLTVANMVIAKVGSGGQVSIYNSAGNTQVVADVIGYFSSTGGLFVPVAPQRLVDTRQGLGGFTAMGAGETHPMAMSTGDPVPTNATAVVVNVTSVDSTIPGYVTVWPTGVDIPLASTLNPRPGAAVPNQAYLRTGAGGQLNALNSAGSTDLIVDVFGYMVPG